MTTHSPAMKPLTMATVLSALLGLALLAAPAPASAHARTHPRLTTVRLAPALHIGALASPVTAVTQPTRVRYSFPSHVRFRVLPGGRFHVRSVVAAGSATIHGVAAYDRHGAKVPLTLRRWAHTLQADASGLPASRYPVLMKVLLTRPGNLVDAEINEEFRARASTVASPPTHHVNARGPAARAVKVPTFVPVPAAYVYCPTCTRRFLHDYCSLSPDSNLWVDFRGPCARHDMAYEKAGGRVLDADDQLKLDIDSNCEYTHGRFDPRRYECYAWGTTYKRVVKSVTYVTQVFSSL